MEGAAAGQRSHLVERDEGTPQDDGIAEVVHPPAAGSTGQLRVLPGRQERMVITRELRQLLDHDRLCRHVDTHRQRLGGEHHLHQALDETRLHHLLEWWHHPRVMCRDAGFELGEERAVAEDREVCRVDGAQTGVDDLSDPIALSTVRQPGPRREHDLGGLIALVATEDEVNGRQHLMLLEQIDDLETRRREQPATCLCRATTGAGTLRTARRLFVETGGIVIDPSVHQGGQQMHAIVGLVADQIQVVELHRTTILDDRGRWPSDR